ncbi:unnamed protein product, partial [Rotaria sp. Silwood1]
MQRYAPSLKEKLKRYIRDNQVYGDCTPETYIHALRTGCRAVE